MTELIIRDGNTVRVDPELSGVIEAIAEDRIRALVDPALARITDAIRDQAVSREHLASIIEQINDAFRLVYAERTGPLVLNVTPAPGQRVRKQVITDDEGFIREVIETPIDDKGRPL